MERKITTIIVVVAIIVAMLGVIFAEQIIPEDLYKSYGILVILGPLVALVVVLIIITTIIDKKSNKKPNLDEKRNELSSQLKVAEKQFLRHKIDKTTFDEISKKKNSELIGVESEMDSQKKQTLSDKDVKKLEGVSRDKQKVLKGLFEQRQKKVHEIKLTEKSYFKRKINEKTFKQINSKIQKDLISIEGKIKSIQTTEQIKQLQRELKLGAKEISKQQKSTEKRKKQLSEIEILEDDLLSQMR
jgi:hypothetical protein